MARVPITSILLDDKDGESYPEYATALFNRIFNDQISARENLNEAKIKFKRYYNSKANPQLFKKDNYVEDLL